MRYKAYAVLVGALIAAATATNVLNGSVALRARSRLHGLARDLILTSNDQ
jgi:hypothetical protein